MALTVTQLAAALRLSDGTAAPPEPVNTLLTRLLGVGTAFVDLLADGAPLPIQEEALIRFCGYLYDSPTAARRDGYSNAWRNSGAGALVARWVVRRIVTSDGVTPSGGNPPGGGIDTDAVNVLIGLHQAISDAHHVPGMGGGTTDQTARDAAAAAQGSIDVHQDEPHNMDTAARASAASAQGEINVHTGEPHNTDTTARSAAADVGTALDTHEADANAHHVPPAGGGGDPVSPPPPMVLADATPYSAHGDVAAANWRTYDFLQILYRNTNGYQSPAINTVQLIANSPVVVPMGRNVQWSIAVSPTDDDVLTISASSGNAVPAPNATSTLTITAWFAGTVVDAGNGGDGVDQTARDAAESAQDTADAAQTSITDHETNHPGAAGSGTQVFIRTTEPTGGTYVLDDVWIQDLPGPGNLKIWRWTGTVWAVDYTLPDLDAYGVYLRARGGTFPTPTEALYTAHAVAALDSLWYYIAETGHLADTVDWTWADLNDGQTDLAQFRGVVSENPFSIQNPQVLDWAYISGEHRWVRRNASTWIYASAPADFDNRYRSQHSAERAGLTTVGKFIFVSNGHRMRIIRAYDGAVPGPATYEWTAFDGPALDLEAWAYADDAVRIQPRKLAEFPAASIAAIPNDGEQWYTLRARVHKNADGSLTSYDLSHWIEEAAAPAGGGGFPMTREEVFNEEMTASNVATHTATEAWLPSQLYEVSIANTTRHLFLTTESGTYQLLYPALNVGAGINVRANLTIGGTGVTQFFAPASPSNFNVTVYKLT